MRRISNSLKEQQRLRGPTLLREWADNRKRTLEYFGSFY